MDERIKEHLKRLNRYYLQLVEIRRISREDFIGDDIHRAAAERVLQTAIESCLNIGNRLLSLLQFEQPVRTPESYADIFIEMRNLNIIDSEFADKLVEMARFRNRLVHLYWDLDPETTYRILQENIEDLKKFQDVVVDFLNKRPESKSGAA
jgi:uncharacterized protein YutE (UPF0331/DUF86 family)